MEECVFSHRLNAKTVICSALNVRDCRGCKFYKTKYELYTARKQSEARAVKRGYAVGKEYCPMRK